MRNQLQDADVAAGEAQHVEADEDAGLILAIGRFGYPDDAFGRRGDGQIAAEDLGTERRLGGKQQDLTVELAGLVDPGPRDAAGVVLAGVTGRGLIAVLVEALGLSEREAGGEKQEEDGSPGGSLLLLRGV